MASSPRASCSARTAILRADNSAQRQKTTPSAWQKRRCDRLTDGDDERFLTLLPSYRGKSRESYSKPLVVASIALLYFGRGRGGDAIPILRNWTLAMLFGMAIMCLFIAGPMGVAANLNWL
jgi:hypothetical protein